jgi:ADP-ribose pyrophosphatase YjhB (NUDIX family)
MLYQSKIGGCFAVLRENLYRLLGFGASICFNAVNLLLGGNLPPFGSACVVIKEGERYLLLEHSNGKIGLPGGYIRWREEPEETARRECREETGLEVRLGDLVGCFSTPTASWARMSTLTVLYSAEIAGGHLRQAIEGRPGWFSAEEALQRLDPYYQRLFEGYLSYYERHPLPAFSS